MFFQNFKAIEFYYWQLHKPLILGWNFFSKVDRIRGNVFTVFLFRKKWYFLLGSLRKSELIISTNIRIILLFKLKKKHEVDNSQHYISKSLLDTT